MGRPGRGGLQPLGYALLSMRHNSPHVHSKPAASDVSHWSPRPWQTNLALLLFGSGLIYLSHQLVSEYHHFTIGFSGVSGLSALLYIASVFLILTQPVDRLTFPLIIVVAIACRIAPLFAEPHLSTDIYRYVWDGIVQHAHISPYRYVPGDPALAFLRAPHQSIYDHINRRDYAHTIYPPVAEALYYLITAVSPTILAMKTFMVLCEAVTLTALIKILRALNLRPEQSLLYAWCPLLVWEIAGSGHLDSVAMACISLALLFRLRRRPILTGLFLGLAIMTKFYPIVLLPALMLPRASGNNLGAPEPALSMSKGLASETWVSRTIHALNPKQWDWTLPLTTLAVIILGYAAYSSAGWLVLGFLNGYAKEEGMTTGTRYFLLDLVQHIPGLQNLPTAAFYIFCILVFAAIKIWALRINSQQPTTSNQPCSLINLPSPGIRLRRRSHAPLLPSLPLVHHLAHPVLHPPTKPAHPHLPDGLLLPLHHLPGRRLHPKPLHHQQTPLRSRRNRSCHPTRITQPHPPRAKLPSAATETFMSTLLPILKPGEAPLDESALSPAARQAEEEKNKMRRYFEKPEEQLSPTVAHEPVCLYLETTNRCNLLCTTCPRTYEQLEPEADMPWELFTRIIDQYPNIARVVLHGIGEPMLVKDIAERVAYLKARNIYVLFNTNGTVLNDTNGRALIEAGLDELRVSLDAADPAVYQMVRGKDFFSKIVDNVRNFTHLQRELNAPKPVVSLWLTGLRETVDQLPNFVRLAHSIGVREVYLQRLVFFDSPQNEHSLARAESALFEHTTEREESLIREAESVAKDLGILFSASGATEPGESIKRQRDDAPWSLCRRPWSLMYITANGRVLPCCIAPFSMKGYSSFTLGDATQSTLREIWNGEAYQHFREGLLTSSPPPACTNCGLRWSL